MHALLVMGCLVAAIWDARCRRIPNTLSFALIALAALSLLGAQQPGPGIFAALSVLLLGVVAWRLGALGGGDVKILVAIALVLGPWMILYGVYLAVCALALALRAMILERRWSVAFALGPAIALALVWLELVRWGSSALPTWSAWL